MKPYRIIEGDVLAGLATLPDASVHCCVTSPPYWGLRDYGVDGQLGLEPTPGEYVEKMVAVFREVRRVLRDDGTLWLNLGDSYASTPKGNPGVRGNINGGKRDDVDADDGSAAMDKGAASGLPSKNLVGIPWRVAFALQADGWYLRSDIIWAKPNPMPESVTDRPTKAHEYLFLLSKSERYHYDAGAVSEQMEHPDVAERARQQRARGDVSSESYSDGAGRCDGNRQTRGGGFATEKTRRNKRTVWTIPTEPFPGAHFAVMPTALVKPCILAGCPTGGTVLDPFTGSGTVAVVAIENGCEFVGCELNPEYVKIAEARIAPVAAQGNLFNGVVS